MADQRTVTISLPPALAREIDEVARSEGRSRSELFREAARQYLLRRGRWREIFAHGESVAWDRGLTEEHVARTVQRERRRRS